MTDEFENETKNNPKPLKTKSMKMKKITLILSCATAAAFLVSSCEKRDAQATITSSVSTDQKFFTSHKPVTPEAMAVQQYLYRLNARRSVALNLVQKAGIPYWDKVLTFKDVKLNSGGRGTAEETATIVHIPFVPENGDMVTASLIVKMSDTDTSLRLISGSDYGNYGFEDTNGNNWTARDVFNILTRLDNAVFDRRAYKVNDGRIFGKQKNDKLLVTVNPDAGSPSRTEQFVTINVCTSNTVCVIGGEPGTGSGVCSTYVHCTAYYIEIPDDGSGGGSGGGTGGGPTGGGGGTGGTGGGLGGGWIPWEDDPGPVTSEVFASVVASGRPVSVNEGTSFISTGATTRTKSYNWRFYEIVSPLFGISFSSTEIGTHVMDPYSFSWKWESLVHSNINKSGTSFLWSAQCNNLVPTSTIRVIPLGGGGYSINVAEMRLDYNIQISYVYGLLNFETNDTHHSQRSWEIND